jgi:hypothetical protein
MMLADSHFSAPNVRHRQAELGTSVALRSVCGRCGLHAFHMGTIRALENVHRSERRARCIFIAQLGGPFGRSFGARFSDLHRADFCEIGSFEE